VLDVIGLEVLVLLVDGWLLRAEELLSVLRVLRQLSDLLLHGRDFHHGRVILLSRLEEAVDRVGSDSILIPRVAALPVLDDPERVPPAQLVDLLCRPTLHHWELLQYQG